MGAVGLETSGVGCGGNGDPPSDGIPLPFDPGIGAAGIGVGDIGAGDGIEFGSNCRVRALAERIGTRTESAAVVRTSITAARDNPTTREAVVFNRFMEGTPK
jgi:hypothetical protein